MAEEKKKIRYITTSEHAMIGHSGSPTDVLAPGERTLLDEEAASHKYLLAQIEAGNPEYAHLSVVEISHEEEAKAEEERKELLAKAEKIAAEQRQEEAQKAIEKSEQPEPLEGQPAVTEGTDFPPQDREAQRLREESGAGQRASTQEDVVEESGKSGRRSSKKG